VPGLQPPEPETLRIVFRTDERSDHEGSSLMV
jgi:hypothetical protein